MNRLERLVDRIDPVVSASVRLVKKRWQGDPLLGFLTENVTTNSAVIDLGANRGVYTWLMAALVGPGGQVHAVEPFPGNVAALTALSRRRRNIVVHPFAASDREAEAVLHVPSHGGQVIDALASVELRACDDESAFTVALRRVDSLLADEDRRVSVLKCDVEGHEDPALEGSWSVVEEHRPAVAVEIEDRHRHRPVEDLFARFTALGYQGYFVQDRAVRPLTEFDVESHQRRFLGGDFIPYSPPAGYVSDFLFLPGSHRRL
ncbi:FkbM family methyltransferase [Actinomycetospora straminea]|uniref:FkbM family methyltransferase n=1 Tax=Actinomycetospora straminea TaxID=663607 RepID=A0ABP9E054_9PSEU|nr:FkbM family methyltransferase [Actinomycetospora straminea]MDD7931049.1 FkbM family methyltransferase [Actinomycetospora straminea]